MTKIGQSHQFLSLFRHRFGPMPRTAGWGRSLLGWMGVLCCWASMLGMSVGCSDDPDPNEEMDAGADAQEDEDSETETETETDSEVDTGENEIPPPLPELCDISLLEYPVSGDGDGRSPDIAADGTAMITWAHNDQSGTTGWRLIVAPYDPSVLDHADTDSDVDTDTSPLGDEVIIESTGPKSRQPVVAARSNAFGLAWLDARDDDECDPNNWSSCQRELLFLLVDQMGQPINGPVPVQITNLTTSGGSVVTRPSIVATTTGYLLVWNERSGGSVQVMARALDANGDFVDAAAHQVSEAEGVYETQSPEVAARGTNVVVVWLAKSQYGLHSRALGTNGGPVGAVQEIQSDIWCLDPAIAAGSDGFVVSWSSRPVNDHEVFTMKLNSVGTPVGQRHRITWTTSDVNHSAIAWNEIQSRYGISWQSSLANGSDDPFPSPQVFVSVLDNDGKLASVPVKVSDDPNPGTEMILAADGSGWTAAWQVIGAGRKRVFIGRMKLK